MKTILTAALLLLSAASAHAQVYDDVYDRPPTQKEKEAAEKARLVIQEREQSTRNYLSGRLDTLRAPIDSATNHLALIGVVSVPGATAADLYARGKLWFVNTFKSPKYVLKTDDKDTGLLIGEGSTARNVWVEGPTKRLEVKSETLWYQIKIGCRDGRYRYEISNLETGTYDERQPVLGYRRKGAVANSKLDVYAADRYLGTIDFMRELGQSIRQAMRQSADGGGGDW